MATAVQMTISLDSAGAIQGVDAVNAAMGRMGNTAKALTAETTAMGTASWQAGTRAQEAFNGIESSERRAHLAGMLITRTSGIEIPRALETIIARSQTLGPILAGLFNVSVFFAGAAALGVVGEKITEMAQRMAGYTEEVKKMEEETVQASRKSFINPETLGATIAHLGEVNARIEEINKQRQELEQATPEIPAAVQGEDLAGVGAAAQMEQQRTASTKEALEAEQERQKLLEWETTQMKQIVSALEDQANLAGKGGMSQIAEQERQAVQKFNESFGNLSHQSEAYERGITAIHATYTAQRQALDRSYQSKSAEAGLQGFALAVQQHKDALAEIQSTDAGNNAAIAAANKEFYAQNASLVRQSAQETMSLRHQVTEADMTGTARVYQQEANEIENLNQKRAQSLITIKDYNAQRVLLAEKAAQQIAALNDTAEQETVGLERKARDASLGGDDLILAHKRDAIAQATAAFARHEIDVTQFERRIVAINQESDAQIEQNDQATADKRKQILEQAAEDQKNAEQTIALASVDEWHRAYAQTLIEAQNKIAAIDHAERKALEGYQETDAQYVAITAADQAKREAIWVETNQKIQEEHKKQVEQLGADLESLFNDISSGNIGQRILNNMKKLFAQIVAQWLLSTQVMGSGFGSVLGSLVFGPGSAGANTLGGGANPLGALLGMGGATGVGAPSTPPFMPGGTPIGSFLSSGSTATAAASGSLSFPGFMTSSSTGLTTDAGFFPTAGGSTTATSPSSSSQTSALGGFGGGLLGGFTGLPSASGALTTGSITSTLGSTAGATLAKPALGNSVGGIFSNFQSAIPSLALMGALLGGSKLGGVGQIGSMVSALAIMAAFQPQGAAAALLGHLGLLGPAGGALALAGGGLLGFGLGQQFGPVVGAIGGAAAGLGIASLGLFGLGGPIGLAIGAIVGLLGGIFGGLFGGGKRKKAANNYFTQQIEPAIKQIEDQYKSFQLDFTGANSQLEQLRTQAEDQLKKLKGEGKDVFKKKVSPAIDAAEKDISHFETERQRRSRLVFGPPQFHDGGLVDATISAFTAKPGELLAMLKHGEYVMSPQATAKNLPMLEQMNRGGSVNVGNNHTQPIVIQAWDGPSVDAWLRNGGAHRIRKGLNRLSIEGH